MYTRFYQLNTEAFPERPSPVVFFQSETHQQAWRFLLSGLKEQNNIHVVSGEYGMGKSLLCLRMVQKLNKQKTHRFLYLPSPIYRYSEILERIAGAYGMSEARQQKTHGLQKNLFFFLKNSEQKHPLFLLIDDAQEYSQEVLSGLKYLADFNISGFFPFRLVFFAHPSFWDRLQKGGLKSLGQRIHRHFSLSAFNFLDTKGYIYFRLLVSGANGIPVFPDESIETIYENTHGVPRIINTICDRCLLLGATQRAEIIDTSLLKQAVDSCPSLSMQAVEGNQNQGLGMPLESRSHKKNVRRFPKGPDQQIPDPEPSVTQKEALPPLVLQEQFEVIKTRLLDNKSEELKIICFVGAESNAGTSMTLVQVAESLARHPERKVLLIDANLRTPVLHERYGQKKGQGLSHLLDNKNVSPKGHVKKVNKSNLYLLSAGQSSNGIPQLFETTRFKQLLHFFASRFDHVLIDVPPGCSWPETRSIVLLADGVVLVLYAGMTRQHTAMKLKESLLDSGAKILGAVLNRRKYYTPQWIYDRI